MMKTVKKIEKEKLRQLWNDVKSERRIDETRLKITGINDYAFIKHLARISLIKRLSFDEFITVLYLFSYEINE